MTPSDFRKLLKQMEHLTDKQHQELQERLDEGDPVQRIIRELEHLSHKLMVTGATKVLSFLEGFSLVPQIFSSTKSYALRSH